MNNLSFFFDSSSCSGCKACQAACKDKHGLEVGRLWRRVYEVSGGGWWQEGAAWVSDAYAYNLSISCNHCEQPACVEACPTTALHKRPDGLALIDAERCIGCQYCTWACPYGAPQYDPEYRVMTKCTGCFDHLEACLPPACVAACPLRVLDFGDPEAMQARYAVNGNGLVQSVAPLPEKELTQPGLLIRPHRDAKRAAQSQPRLANLEEVHTAPPQDERPLVLFTVLAQMAVGAFIILGVFVLQLGAREAKIPVLCTGLVMLSALLVSLLHLGSPQRAYQAAANWRTSWLSREILMAGVFTAGLALFNLLQWIYPPGPPLGWPRGYRGTWSSNQSTMYAVEFFLTTLIGLALVYSISRVYRLRTIKVWNSRYTTAAFFATTFLLGPLLASALLFLNILPVMNFDVYPSGVRISIASQWIARTALVVSLVQALISWLEHPQKNASKRDKHRFSLRLGLLGLSAIASCLILLQFPVYNLDGVVMDSIFLISAFIFALASELLGRWMFYAKKAHSGL